MDLFPSDISAWIIRHTQRGAQLEYVSVQVMPWGLDLHTNYRIISLVNDTILANMSCWRFVIKKKITWSRPLKLYCDYVRITIRDCSMTGKLSWSSMDSFITVRLPKCSLCTGHVCRNVANKDSSRRKELPFRIITKVKGGDKTLSVISTVQVEFHV